MADETFWLDMQVRDYECDMQGIVNNAIYQHYLEHARHEFLQTRGLRFSELTHKGIIIVVVRAELDYRRSLHSGEKFRVSVSASRPTPVRLQFDQLIRNDAAQDVLQAKIVATTINDRNRPYFPAELEALISG